MNPNTATKALESINPSDLVEYHRYFDTIRPADDVEIFRRGLFAFASVHTTYRKNVDLFALLWDLEWVNSKTELRARIEESRAGLSNNRTKYIWQFAASYWKDPTQYLRFENETWPEYRDRVESMTLGLGHAKTSFYAELIYFHDARVVCGDTHQLQLYGLKGNSSPGRKTMDYVERHWVEECSRLNIPPVSARWYLWDRKQGKKNSSYWSYVLEGGKPETMLPRQLEFPMMKEIRRAA
jgi:hypothetical protein